MDKMKIMGFHQPPYHNLWRPSIPKRHPQISPHIHQKMRNRCKNNYIEAFGPVYWAKNAVLKKILGGCNNPPLEDEG